MTLKKVAVLGSVISSIMMSAGVSAMEDKTFSAIKNNFKESEGVETCLRVFENSNVVAMGECPENKQDVPYRKVQWKAEKQDNGFYLLKNRDRSLYGSDSCLRVFNKSNRLEVGECEGEGGSQDYQSMRLWQISADGDFNVLKTKFHLDARIDHCLVANKNNDSVIVSHCGKAEDGTKLWSSTALPFGETMKAQEVAIINYHMQDIPESGLDRISFPITVEKAVKKAEFQYDAYFRFIGGDNTRLALRPIEHGKAFALVVVYNSNNLPASAQSEQCKNTKEGVSCNITLDLQPEHEYSLIAQRDEQNPDIWHGYIENTTTGEINEIGAWKPGFAENGVGKSHRVAIGYTYPTNSCSSIPLTEVNFGAPIGNGEVVAKFAQPQMTGDCKGRLDFNTERSSNGWNISLQGK